MIKRKSTILILVISILVLTNIFWSIRSKCFIKEFYAIDYNEIIEADILAVRINRNKVKSHTGTKFEIRDPKVIEMILFEVRNGESYEPNHPQYNNEFLLSLRTKSGKIFNATLNTSGNDKYIYIYQIKKGFVTSDFKKLKSKKLFEFMRAEKLI